MRRGVKEIPECPLKLFCFAAGTPLLLNERGDSKPIEQLVENVDRVLARPEDDPDGPVRECLVEELFQRQAALLDLRIGGRTIRTTAEHPFWVEGRGWLAAGELVEGDRLRCLDGWAVLGGVSTRV